MEELTSYFAQRIPSIYLHEHAKPFIINITKARNLKIKESVQWYLCSKLNCFYIHVDELNKTTGIQSGYIIPYHYFHPCSSFHCTYFCKISKNVYLNLIKQLGLMTGNRSLIDMKTHSQLILD